MFKKTAYYLLFSSITLFSAVGYSSHATNCTDNYADDIRSAPDDEGNHSYKRARLSEIPHNFEEKYKLACSLIDNDKSQQFEDFLYENDKNIGNQIIDKIAVEHGSNHKFFKNQTLINFFEERKRKTVPLKELSLLKEFIIKGYRNFTFTPFVESIDDILDLISMAKAYCAVLEEKLESFKFHLPSSIQEASGKLREEQFKALVNLPTKFSFSSNSLDFSNAHLNESLVSRLADYLTPGLHDNTSRPYKFTTLILDNTTLGEHGIKRIACMLANNSAVTNLSLKSCQIGDNELSLLVKEGLLNNAVLYSINLSNNNISDLGILYHPTYKTIRVDRENDSYSYAYSYPQPQSTQKTIIKHFGKHSKVQKINLSSNKLDVRNISAIKSRGNKPNEEYYEHILCLDLKGNDQIDSLEETDRTWLNNKLRSLGFSSN